MRDSTVYNILFQILTNRLKQLFHPLIYKIRLLTYLCGSSAKYIPPQDQKPRLFKKAEFAKERNKTEPERAVLNVKINRKKKNCMLKTSQEARIINKLQKKSAAMLQKMAELGVTYEVQVSSIYLSLIFCFSLTMVPMYICYFINFYVQLSNVGEKFRF